MGGHVGVVGEGGVSKAKTSLMLLTALVPTGCSVGTSGATLTAQMPQSPASLTGHSGAPENPTDLSHHRQFQGFLAVTHASERVGMLAATALCW